jgi:hypothetical protein
MKISAIYEKYKIMPQLQTHMLRVAGVASIICDNFQSSVDKSTVISACLLHDMGNIIKSDLKKFPEFLRPQGMKYWLNIKKNFINKYGTNDHQASLKINREIGVSDLVLHLINAISFSKAKKSFETKSFEIKICHYSDLRVMPYGVDSLKNRLKDLKLRYAKRMKEQNWNDFDYLANFFVEIEKQIFAHCKLKPEDITEEKVLPITKKLKTFEIVTK